MRTSKLGASTRHSMIGVACCCLLSLGCGNNQKPDETRHAEASTTAPPLKDPSLPVAGVAQPKPLGDTITLQIPSELVFRRVSPSRYGIERPDFVLLETEVTNAMYAQYLTATGRAKGDEQTLRLVDEREKRNSTTFSFSTVDPIYEIRDRSLLWSGNKPPAGKESFPVTLLTVHDGAAFCDWLTEKFPAQGTFRYPTEQEWLIAAYGANRKYPWGDEWDVNRVCCSVGKVRTSGEEVRARADGRTPEGIYGMWGNALEYVIHQERGSNALFVGVGSQWMGGSFASKKFEPSMNYWGYAHSSEGRADDIGFRVLLDPSDKKHQFKHQVPYDRETP